MKVFYINELCGTVISNKDLNKLNKNSKILVDYEGRKIEYSLDDIYNCKDWKIYTQDDYSLNVDDVRELMSNVDKNSELYMKLKNEETKLLNIWVEDITSSFQMERSLY